MTNLSETDRSQIYTELAAATSPKTAEILMREVLDVHWEDLVTKADYRPEFAGLRGEFAELRSEFAELRSEFAELKGEVAELRSDMRVGFAEMNAHLERQFRIQSNRMIALMIALFSLLGGLVLAVH